jgi:histone chaperone ASF1
MRPIDVINVSLIYVMTAKYKLTIIEIDQQVIVLDNPTQMTNPFQFDISFECLQELPNDLEWKVTYVGNAEDQNQDQILGELVMVGPLAVGINKFVLQAPPPNFNMIANDDLIGVTVVLISCFYQETEILRIGYDVTNEYTVDLVPNANGVGFVTPNPVDITLLRRNIAADYSEDYIDDLQEDEQDWEMVSPQVKFRV